MSERPAQKRRLRITGLHHVTIICRDLERTTAFYRDVLGLPLAEQTVNDDDPDARHFVFGDGEAGTLVTAFEYPEMEAGQVGVGSTHHFALCVESEEELEAWRAWLASRGVPCTEVLDRRRCKSVYLRDPDGHIIELATRGPGSGGGTPA